MSQVIVVGGGLAGMSAAHTVIQNGGRVVVLDKSAFCGGNSTKVRFFSPSVYPSLHLKSPKNRQRVVSTVRVRVRNVC